MTAPKPKDPIAEALKPLPIRQVVYECVEELHAQNRASSRERVAQITGINARMVGEAFEGLIEAKKLVSIGRGIVEPAQPNQSRAVSTTAIGRHGVKIEVGDQIMTIYTAEARDLARYLAGYLVSFDRA